MMRTAVQQTVDSAAGEQVLLIVEAGNPAAADLAEQWNGGPARVCSVREADATAAAASGNVDTMIVMLRLPWCAAEDPLRQAAMELVRTLSPRQVCFVTGCTAHFENQIVDLTQKDCGEPRTERFLNETEARLLSDVPVGVQATVVRCGFLLSPRSETAQRLSRWSWLSALLPESLRATFVTIDELAALLSDVSAHTAPPSARMVTLIGRNRSWRDVLAAAMPTDRRPLLHRILTGAARVLAVTGLGWLPVAVVWLLRRMNPKWGVLSFRTLTPRSESELLSLCHRRNIGNIAVCGYNNGVNHFGWDYAHRTAVSTIRSGRTLQIRGDTVTADAGITLKECVDALHQQGRELLVVPNYSYISLGTVFFVPVHGSGSEVSTLGDTVEWVRLYDPQTDVIEETTRGEPLFLRSMYDMSGSRVLLELRLRTRPKAEYFVEQEVSHDPTAAEVWSLFSDPAPSNIEVRKHRAADRSIQVSRYYTSGSDSGQRLQIPRDSLGSLWDRLEENRVTAFLFHWLVRNLAFHVELFLREDEFRVFWQHHQMLPLSKIQLRVVRRDGMPNSAFCSEDCVSADLFMHKRHRSTFLKFAGEYLPDVRFNPGKQSMRGRDE